MVPGIGYHYENLSNVTPQKSQLRYKEHVVFKPKTSTKTWGSQCTLPILRCRWFERRPNGQKADIATRGLRIRGIELRGVFLNLDRLRFPITGGWGPTFDEHNLFCQEYGSSWTSLATADVRLRIVTERGIGESNQDGQTATNIFLQYCARKPITTHCQAVALSRG